MNRLIKLIKLLNEVGREKNSHPSSRLFIPSGAAGGGAAGGGGILTGCY